MKNLTLENITKACKGVYHGDESKLDREVGGVVIDSRKVQKDYLFVAIDGENVNAHQFIPDTIEKRRIMRHFPRRPWRYGFLLHPGRIHRTSAS